MLWFYSTFVSLMLKAFLIRSFLLASILVASWSAFATHNRAGEITYEHVSGLTYRIKITTYTKASAVADRPWLKIRWGDEPANVRTNLATVYRAMGVCDTHVVTAHQVHGNRVARVGQADGGSQALQAVGLQPALVVEPQIALVDEGQAAGDVVQKDLGGERPGALGGRDSVIRHAHLPGS